MTDKQALKLADKMRCKGWTVWFISGGGYGWQIDAQRSPNCRLETVLSEHHWGIVQAQEVPRLRFGDHDWTRPFALYEPMPEGQLGLFDDGEDWLPGVWPDWDAYIKKYEEIYGHS